MHVETPLQAVINQSGNRSRWTKHFLIPDWHHAQHFCSSPPFIYLSVCLLISVSRMVYLFTRPPLLSDSTVPVTILRITRLLFGSAPSIYVILFIYSMMLLLNAIVTTYICINTCILRFYIFHLPSCISPYSPEPFVCLLVPTLLFIGPIIYVYIFIILDASDTSTTASSPRTRTKNCC